MCPQWWKEKDDTQSKTMKYYTWYDFMGEGKEGDNLDYSTSKV